MCIISKSIFVVIIRVKIPSMISSQVYLLYLISKYNDHAKTKLEISWNVELSLLCCVGTERERVERTQKEREKKKREYQVWSWQKNCIYTGSESFNLITQQCRNSWTYYKAASRTSTAGQTDHQVTYVRTLGEILITPTYLSDSFTLIYTISKNTRPEGLASTVLRLLFTREDPARWSFLSDPTE